MSDDPRIDPLNSSAILTDTQLRCSFAPRDPEERVVALQVPVRKAKLDQLASMMKLGTFHIQIKSGFEPERSIALKPEEVPLLMDALDRVVTELPRAQAAKAVGDE